MLREYEFFVENSYYPRLFIKVSLKWNTAFVNEYLQLGWRDENKLFKATSSNIKHPARFLEKSVAENAMVVNASAKKLLTNDEIREWFDLCTLTTEHWIEVGTGTYSALKKQDFNEFIKTGNDKLITKYLSNPKSVSFSRPRIAGPKWKPKKGRGFKSFYDMDPVFEAEISRVKNQQSRGVRGQEELINGIKNWQTVFNLGDSVCYKYRFVEYEV